MNILVVEDDAEMAELLVHGLREESYDVDLARDGGTALQLSGQNSFDLILLDVMFPGTDGLEVARRLRRQGQQTPVLMLTARDALTDIVNGLDAGADDYLTKPFSFLELLARIRALGRRGIARPKSVLESQDLVLDVSSYRVFRAGRELHLSLTEFRLLELLMRNAGRIVSRQCIFDSLWGCRREIAENTIDAFIRLLRRKIDCGAKTPLIRTHRGFGYSVGDLH
jgi:DNA-binding response OmpR family regulator